MGYGVHASRTSLNSLENSMPAMTRRFSWSPSLNRFSSNAELPGLRSVVRSRKVLKPKPPVPSLNLNSAYHRSPVGRKNPYTLMPRPFTALIKAFLISLISKVETGTTLHDTDAAENQPSPSQSDGDRSRALHRTDAPAA